MEFSCHHCKRETSELRRCTGCYKAYYCSKTCQKSDWKSGHREACNKLTRASGGRIHSTNKEGYQNTEPSFQTTEDKEESGKEKNGVRNLSDSENCFVCGKTKSLKTCSRCKKIKYCSKECQTKDWNSHKKACESEFDGHIKTKGFKEREKSNAQILFNSIANARDRDCLPFVDLLHQINDVDLSKRHKTSDKEFNLAIDLAQKFHPCHRIMYDIDNLSSEFFGIRPPGSSDVLVAFISRYHHYRHRHCIYIEDKYGQEIYVAFYLDFNNPFPFFSWNDLRPGRFISIRDPYIHYFMDGSVGIRVDEASDVKIFNV